MQVQHRCVSFMGCAVKIRQHQVASTSLLVLLRTLVVVGQVAQALN
jgi:hypothetical protein